LINLQFQQGLRLDALTTGTTFVPCSLGVALAAFLSPLLVTRIGRFVLAIGAALQIAGILAMIAPAFGNEPVLPGSLWLAMLVLGLGQGLTLSPLANVVLASSRSAHAGAAAGVLGTFQQLGGSVGVAIVGAAFASFLAAHQTWGEALGHALVFHLIFFSAIFGLSFILPKPTLASIGKGVSVGKRITGAAPVS
jgi:MFS family permease